ncbi:MAG: TauD/TfdA family dioxygenase [Pseudomonadales bacterium]|nr:TauD/TfdA family dioxygenase [Pseudomonadales bacterium]
MNSAIANILPVDPQHSALIESVGATLTPLDPIGAVVQGLDLDSVAPPPAAVINALEYTMAQRGFIVFKSKRSLSPEHFLRASCWWGGKVLHSTHGVHPATPSGNRHIFRLSNDARQGIPGVGPQWHNDGSFNIGTFSHAGYHMVRAAEKGGGTCFAHQGAAFDVLTGEQKALWCRLSSVNATSGAVHPAVHSHPISNRRSIWLHLGMTGAVILKHAKQHTFSLLDAAELTRLCRQYNAVLNAGFDNGYSIEYEYETNDCVFIDNLAVAHRASAQAHLPAQEQGLRIMHRSTTRAVNAFKPDFALPSVLDITAPSPLGEGVWQAGGIGFRWEPTAPMRN